jgi:hypothetical protein
MFVKFVKDDKTIEEVSISSEMIPFPTDIVVLEAQPLEKILVEHSSYVSTHHLKERLLKEGVKEHKCECCGSTKWMGEPIALELHHINGVKDDLRIENLQILCPNCHAFTDNYRGRNINK